jgi:hypothetical protein
MDMTKYTDAKKPEFKLRKHTEAIREHQVSVALMMLYLAGYDVELRYTGKPLASLAQEALDELGYDGIDIWSCSTKDGGVWTTEQRRMLKTGESDE